MCRLSLETVGLLLKMAEEQRLEDISLTEIRGEIRISALTGRLDLADLADTVARLRASGFIVTGSGEALDSTGLIKLTLNLTPRREAGGDD